MTDTWSDDDRLSRLVNAGRQLVDGVSGARPGSRGPARPSVRSPVRGRGAGVPRFDQLGRWVEDKLDRILDEDEDWREPWQETPPEKPSRRPLEAISRRGRFVAAPEPVSDTRRDGEEWPRDDDFAVPRWQRPPDTRGGARPLPRSTRRR